MDEVKPSEDFSSVKISIENWLTTLKTERKCKSTNTVSKLVNHSTLEIQENARLLISQEINLLLSKCIKSRDLRDMLDACNTINGCFDNFTHAADAIRYSFFETLSFVHCVIDEFLSISSSNKKTVNLAMELLYCLSRILILILKLGRYQCLEHKEKFHNSCSRCNDLLQSEKKKRQLKSLTEKISVFLERDDILFDTKNNFAIGGVLIREMLVLNKDKLVEYKKKLIMTILDSLASENKRLHTVQFLISSAIINTMTDNCTDNDTTYNFMLFFVKLCEKYSSEIPIVLNVSRTLLLLIKHKCFKEILSGPGSEKFQLEHSLFPCVFMLLEHPVACVRNSARDFLPELMSHIALQEPIIFFARNISNDFRSYFISVAAIANKIGLRELIKYDENLPNKLLNSLYDSTMVSHVSVAIESSVLNDTLVQTCFPHWCELWIVPLLFLLRKVPSIVAAEIDKILEKTFKKYPDSVLYVTEKWKYPASDEEIRCLITALKISHKQGFKFKNSSEISLSVKEERNSNESDVNGGYGSKWKMLISKKLLKHCLHHGDDEIRTSAFALLVEARKTTEPYLEDDFELIIYFLKYNLNNHQPSTRQKIMSLIRKMLVRFCDSRVSIFRESNRKKNVDGKKFLYDSFLTSLVEFCFTNIFVGCNFNRLNTVLNILLMCFENINDMSFDAQKADYYWAKLLIALDSSYEENKELVVILSKKLNYSNLTAARTDVTRILIEKSLSLICHMEPPDVLTGAYLLEILIHFPSTSEILSKYYLNISHSNGGDIYFLCIQMLTRMLKEQVALAKLDLVTAATCGPMYGTLSAIRLIFKNVKLSYLIDGIESERERSLLANWSEILNNLVDVCLNLIPTVASIVNSSSPEGHLPMDFQTDCKDLKLKDFASGEEERNQLIDVVYDNFLKKWKRIESDFGTIGCINYETLRSLKNLLKEGKLLLRKTNFAESRNLISDIHVVENKIKDILQKVDKNKRVIDRPATAQVLLLCAWRSIKEVSLYLGDLVKKLPLEIALDLGFISEATLIRIGEELKVLLCEIKHRGSFEHVYIGITHFVDCLWKCSRSHLSNFPRLWLREIISHLDLPTSDQKLKLCATRRSAGLPFLVQAIICSEIVSVKSSTPSSLHAVMKSLLEIMEKGVADNSDSKIHALNILRALFRHSQLGEHVSPYISRALMVAIRGSRGTTWSERNSSSLLFSSLMIRIFGVARSKDELSRKNRMMIRTFFQRYFELYGFLLSEINLVAIERNTDIYPKPSLYLILLILGRLNPESSRDENSLDFSEFLEFVNRSCGNPIMKVRQLAAKALVPLIPEYLLHENIQMRFKALSEEKKYSENMRHGILLQILALLKESVNIKCYAIDPEWLENTKWLLRIDTRKKSSVVAHTYLKILHLLHRFFSSGRKKVQDIVFESFVEHYKICIIERSIKTNLGIELFLEAFFYLKFDIMAMQWIDKNPIEDSDPLITYLLDMLKCNLDDIKSLAFRILYSIFKDEKEPEFDEDDFTRIGDSPEEMCFFQEKKNVLALGNSILRNDKYCYCLFEVLLKMGKESSEPVVIRRLRLRAFSRFLLRNQEFSNGSNKFFLINPIDIDRYQLALKDLAKSYDKEISSNALIVLAVLLKSQDETKINELSNLLLDFSSADADVKEKLAVAKIMNCWFDDFIKKNLIHVMHLWMIPFKFLIDESLMVRMTASNFVCELHNCLLDKSKSTEMLVRMESLESPVCNLVSLKAQECLLDSYVNLIAQDKYLNLVNHMLAVALSSSCRSEENNEDSVDEFGVFEKGNPNPYYEEVAVSRVISDKLVEWSCLINMKEILEAQPNDFLINFIHENFDSDCKTAPLFNLACLVKKLKISEKEEMETFNEDPFKKNKEFSIAWMQKKIILKALNDCTGVTS